MRLGGEGGRPYGHGPHGHHGPPMGSGLLPPGTNPVAAVGLGVAIFSVGCLLYGIGNVEVTEQALNYSLLTRKVELRPYTAGRYWIGPFNYFIKFPAILTTIQFSDEKMQTDLALGGERELRSRTKDGLDVFIEISFQYQLQTPSLYSLYTNLGGYPEYHNTFVRLAIDRLTEAATQFTANEFFTDRTRIGKDMEMMLLKDFEKRLYSTVFSFQLRSVGLPSEFEEAIQETEVMKQDMKVALMEQNSTRVALETALMQATRRTKVAASKASGEAQSTMLANKADISQYLAMNEKSADSFSGILANLDNNEREMLSYMQARVLRDHPGDKTMIGLQVPGPSAELAGPL